MNMRPKWVKEGDQDSLMLGDLSIGYVYPSSGKFMLKAKGFGCTLVGDVPTRQPARRDVLAFVRENTPKPAATPKMQRWSADAATFYGRKDGYYVRRAPGERVSVHRSHGSLSGLIAEFPSVGSGNRGVNNNHAEAEAEARAFVRMMNGAQ